MKAAPWENPMKIRLLKWILLGPVVTLLLFGHCFGAEDDYDIRRPPPGQPDQMWSQVGHDLKLADTFFESDAFGYPCTRRVDRARGSDETEDGNPSEYSAMCFSNSLGVKHVVEFSDARLVDMNTIELFIYHDCPGFNDHLLIQVRSGVFACQYWTFYAAPGRGVDLTWATKRQELTLDKEAYRKGDTIKGRIDFECLEETTNPKYVEKYAKYQNIIRVHGVFKTIVR